MTGDSTRHWILELQNWRCNCKDLDRDGQDHHLGGLDDLGVWS